MRDEFIFLSLSPRLSALLVGWFVRLFVRSFVQPAVRFLPDSHRHQPAGSFLQAIDGRILPHLLRGRVGHARQLRLDGELWWLEWSPLYPTPAPAFGSLASICHSR